MTVTALSRAHFGEIVSVFNDAFAHYPVMRFVAGKAEPYEHRVRRLIELFVANRVYRDEAMFGIRSPAGQLVAAVTTTRPDSPPAPPEVVALRQEIWAELGDTARARYDAYVKATDVFAVPERHHHVNMIGSLRAEQGRGHGRRLLASVHELCASDAHSSGVALTTEHAPNVAWYERAGYAVRGGTRVAPDLETWTLFRPRSALTDAG